MTPTTNRPHSRTSTQSLRRESRCGLLRLSLMPGIILLLLSPGLLFSQARTTEVENAEITQCQANLKHLGDGIRAYRRVHREIPNSLSELYPRFVADPATFQCPTCRRLGITSDDILRSGTIDNPQVTYTYEFGSVPIPENISGGSPRTMREWKQLQMALLGGKVPMVRCHCHEQSLNLSFDGDVYAGPPDWEDSFRDVVPYDDLMFSSLFARFTSFNVIQIPERAPNTPPRLIDLSPYYNASLTRGWHSADESNNLLEMPRGTVEIGGRIYDVRGVIQLTATKRYQLAHFPVVASNIVVGLRARSVDILHATAHEVNRGLVIARYVFHYIEGEPEVFPILYGEHILDWWSDPDKPGRFKPSADHEIAWRGTNERRRPEGKQIHVYRSRWHNPHPDRVIQSVDFISEMEPSAPFLLAISAELVPDK